MNNTSKTLLERAKQSFEDRINNPQARRQFLIDAGILDENLEYVDYFKTPTTKDVLIMSSSNEEVIASAMDVAFKMLDNESCKMKIKMFKAIDGLDGTVCLFAVRGDEVAISSYNGDSDMWSTKKGFFWCTPCFEPFDNSRMINPTMIWEEEG